MSGLIPGKKVWFEDVVQLSKLIIANRRNARRMQENGISEKMFHTMGLTVNTFVYKLEDLFVKATDGPGYF